MEDIIWAQAVDDDMDLVLSEWFSESENEFEAQHGGSRAGKCANIERERERFAQQLYNDYFSSSPTYPDHLFQRRFRVSKRIFFIIHDAVCLADSYFTQRRDCTGRKGLSSLQKITAAMRLLAYGASADSLDETLRLAESTALECLERFTVAIRKCFATQYLRSPTLRETETLLIRAEKLGFPGMLGSIDCSKWAWKNCPTAYHGQYKGKEQIPTITLEAIADDRLYIWHAFFGIPGCNNDITVFDSSTIPGKMASGEYPNRAEYTICGEKRNKPYLLADGIYPRGPLFVHSIANPATEEESMYAACQEGRRKDVERAFGVLQSKFHIIAVPSRLWSSGKMTDVIDACVIIHNMVVCEQRPLSEEVDTVRASSHGNVRVGDGIDYCFEKLTGDGGARAGTVAAISAVNNYLSNAHEYMRTRRLVFQHVTERWYVYSFHSSSFNSCLARASTFFRIKRIYSQASSSSVFSGRVKSSSS